MKAWLKARPIICPVVCRHNTRDTIGADHKLIDFRVPRNIAH